MLNNNPSLGITPLIILYHFSVNSSIHLPFCSYQKWYAWYERLLYWMINYWSQVIIDIGWSKIILIWIYIHFKNLFCEFRIHVKPWSVHFFCQSGSWHQHSKLMMVGGHIEKNVSIVINKLISHKVKKFSLLKQKGNISKKLEPQTDIYISPVKH